MHKKKLWIFMAIFTVFAMLVVSCAPAAEATPTPTEAAMEQPTDTPAMEAPTDTPAMEEPTETAPAEEELGGTVNVLVVWGGDELESFEALLAPFEEETGVDVQIESTRDLNAVLTTRVEGGNPPDIAGLPGPGQLQSFAETGDLVPLNDVVDMERLRNEYDEGFINLAMSDGDLFGVFLKATVKSLVWYSPPAFEAAGYEVPTSWEELNALEQQIIDDGAAPWCIGLESGAASGWPGTDWIEDIMLRTAGPETYDQWWQHEIAWTADPIRNAWDTWGTVVNNEEMIYGGQSFVLSTNFGEAPFPMFQDPVNCYLHRQASFITTFITDQFPDLQPVEDFNFFGFPPIDEQLGSPLLIAGDLFGMFNDTPQARALIEYLTTAEAQSIWAERGGFLAPNREVSPEVYPDDITRQIAELLVTADAVRFDASDLMPSQVNDAFWGGILEFVRGDGEDLDQILQNIEQVAEGAY